VTHGIKTIYANKCQYYVDWSCIQSLRTLKTDSNLEID